MHYEDEYVIKNAKLTIGIYIHNIINSDAYWDEVNAKIAENQKRNMKLNERFKPTKKLMEQEFTI